MGDPVNNNDPTGLLAPRRAFKCYEGQCFNAASGTLFYPDSAGFDSWLQGPSADELRYAAGVQSTINNYYGNGFFGDGSTPSVTSTINFGDGSVDARSQEGSTISANSVFPCAPVKPASCMRMRVPLGEGRAAHAGLEHARLSASSVVKRCERKVQAWY